MGCGHCQAAPEKDPVINENKVSVELGDQLNDLFRLYREKFVVMEHSKRAGCVIIKSFLTKSKTCLNKSEMIQGMCALRQASSPNYL